MTTQREIERLTRQREPIPFVWRGIDYWRCPFCAWDRDDEAAVQAHIDAKHPEDVPTELQLLTAAASAKAAQEAADEPEPPPKAARQRRAATTPETAEVATEENGDAPNDGREDDGAVPQPDGGGGGDGDGGGHGQL